LYIEYSLFTIGGSSTGYFEQKCEGIALVQQAQFTFWFIDSAGIHKYAALYQVAVYIGHHTAYIPLGIRSAGIVVLFLTNINVFLNGLFILEEITVVNRIDFTKFRSHDVCMAQTKFTDRSVKRKSV